MPPTSCETFGGLNFMDAIGSESGLNPIQFASQLIGSGSNIFNNQNFYVKGKFTIDATILFYRCKFKMEPGSEIIVKSHLRSRTTHYFACNGMWKGIKVEDAGKISFDVNGSIEDAEKALDVTEKCKWLFVEKTTFNRNRIGVFLSSSTGVNATIKFSSFNRNIFNCTSVLNSGRWAVSGVYASNVNVPNLGEANIPIWPPTPLNTFTNVFKGTIGNGIYANKSLLNIKYCRFEEINEIKSLAHAVGIYAINSNITLKGLGTPYMDLQGVGSATDSAPADDATFYNCRDGAIITESSHLKVEEAFMYFNSELSKNIKSVIQCTNNANGEEFEIINNHISIKNSILDINIINISRGNANLNIFRNQISSNFEDGLQLKRVSIRIVKGHSISSSAFIEENLIVSHSVNNSTLINTEGIKLEGGDRYFVNKNRLPSHGNKMNIGINAIDIQLPSEIKHNYIQFVAIGIRLFSSLQQFISTPSPDGAAPGAIKVCDNELEACDKGTLFIGGHTVVLANNHYYENKKALVLEKGSVFNARIGIQWKDEKFRKNYFERDLGVANTNNSAEMPNSGDAKLSQFGIDTRANLQGGLLGAEYSKVAFENIDPTNFRTTWFSDQLVNNDVGCEIILTAIAAWEDLDDAILTGTYSNQSLALRQEVDAYLFDKLSKYPELILGHPEREAFFNEKQQTNIPIFNQLRKSIDNVFEYSAAHQAQLNDLQTQLNTQKTNWINLVKTYNAEFGENEWSEAAHNAVQTLSDNIATIQVAMASLTAQINEAATNRINTLIALNATVAPQSPHEIFAKNANHLWLRMLLTKNHLSNDELAEVRTIAATCYKDAGRAKYIAINILPESEAEGYINNSCQMEGRIAYTPKGQTTMGVKIMPNPANEIINIETNNGILNPCTEIILADISGKVLKKIENTNESNNFLMETQSLTNGIYFLHLKSKDNSTRVHKVVILH